MQSLQRVHSFKTIIASTTKHFSKRICHVIAIIACDTCFYHSTAVPSPVSVTTTGIRSSQRGPYGGGYWSWCVHLKKSIIRLYYSICSYYYILSLYIPWFRNNNFFSSLQGLLLLLLYKSHLLFFLHKIRGKYCVPWSMFVSLRDLAMRYVFYKGTFFFFSLVQT